MVPTLASHLQTFVDNFSKIKSFKSSSACRNTLLSKCITSYGPLGYAVAIGNTSSNGKPCRDRVDAQNEFQNLIRCNDNREKKGRQRKGTKQAHKKGDTY